MLAPGAGVASELEVVEIDGLFVVIRNTPRPSTPPSIAAPRTPTTIHAFERGGLGSE